MTLGGLVEAGSGGGGRAAPNSGMIGLHGSRFGWHRVAAVRAASRLRGARLLSRTSQRHLERVVWVAGWVGVSSGLRQRPSESTHTLPTYHIFHGTHVRVA